ncbi:hypothetical protein [Roseovarius sp. Pro17]|uniref:hypothetical protein n=1 Tax=Roseovarius sp. Pro17 TaxID=3108175 RepID=UPI002D78E466|nr:hypothetical protein [Roseovarius sp. Pro17]
MFTDTFTSTHAKRALDGNNHVVHSTVPRIRPHHKFITAIIISAMVVIFADISITHAQTAVSVDEPAFTLAQAAPSGADDGRGGPPREAVEVCASLPVDAICGFAGRDGQQISGTCRSPEADIPLVCAPADLPQNG